MTSDRPAVGAAAPPLYPTCDEFVDEAAAAMRERMYHGARKFGAISWREDPYTDEDNYARLVRAVEHLSAALVNAGNDETRKRAADVANQAFMFADPLRYRDENR